MRTLLVIFISLFNGNIGIAQHISVSTLIKLNNNNWDDFDTYVIKKGYDFQLTNQQTNYEERNYAYGATSLGKAPYFISKTIWKNNLTKYVSYQTTNPKDYLSIKNELKALKFLYIKSDVWDKYTVYYYKKGQLELEIYVRKSLTSSGNIITGYDITLGSNLSADSK